MKKSTLKVKKTKVKSTLEVKIQAEVDFKVFEQELLPFMGQNYKDNELNGDNPFALNLEVCKTLFDTGILKVITARTPSDNKFVGYAFWMVTTPLEMKTTLVASLWGFFTVGEQRGKGVGRRLIERSVKYLQLNGAKRIFFNVRDTANFSGMIKDLGGRAIETLYVIE